MRIFLASANLEDIGWASTNGLADGVLVTHSLLAEERRNGDSSDTLAQICRQAGVPVAVPVSSVRGPDIYRDARDLAKTSDQVIVQIPFVEDAVPAMRRLGAEGIRVAATLVFNAAQAILAAKAGATMVCANVDQLDEHGHEGVEVIREIRTVFNTHAVECDLLASHPRHASQFTECALAGADAIAIRASVLRSLLLHPLTDRGLDQFLADLSRRPKARATV